MPGIKVFACRRDGGIHPAWGTCTLGLQSGASRLLRALHPRPLEKKSREAPVALGAGSSFHLKAVDLQVWSLDQPHQHHLET